MKFKVGDRVIGTNWADDGTRYWVIHTIQNDPYPRYRMSLFVNGEMIKDGPYDISHVEYHYRLSSYASRTKFYQDLKEIICD